MPQMRFGSIVAPVWGKRAGEAGPGFAVVVGAGVRWHSVSLAANVLCHIPGVRILTASFETDSVRCRVRDWHALRLPDVALGPAQSSREHHVRQEGRPWVYLHWCEKR